MRIEFDVEVDASGLMCPLPLLRLKKALTIMSGGEVIKVIATDPAAHLDFGVFVEQAGHELVLVDKQSDKQIFFYQKTVSLVCVD
ncbi:sulfurtransferase TusA family protein [Methylocucumis oryzae]|uniref:SirA-like domain-containing protein n=1 Tax=Methylocucumis oryzae TaxID=1632867 RepID=A0A0F3IHB0_9GAMM|nr:SirA-like domain-containing protein [Methylocucumis oryzae]